MERPKRPTYAMVNQYVQEFNEGDTGLTDKTLTRLFLTFPQNVQLEHVLLKVVTLNALYYTGILAVIPVAKHIWQLEIDAKLAQCVPDLVDEIAPTPIKDGKIRRNYSFATKYCSWHVPDAYPIFDSFVEQLLCEYQKLDEFSDFKRNDLWEYPKFKRIIEDFKAHYGLIDCSFRELDKFLWLHSKEYFDKTR